MEPRFHLKLRLQLGMLSALFTGMALLAPTLAQSQCEPKELVQKIARASAPTFQKREIEDLAQVVPRVRELVAKYGAENVVVGFDCDDVLSKTVTFLGSEPWYNLQLKRIEEGKMKTDLIKTPDDLILFQYYLFQQRSLIPTQENTAEIIREIQALGAKTVVLTSRNPMLMEITRKNLEGHGVVFANNTIGPANGSGGTFTPYEPTSPQKSGLTPEEFKLYGLSDKPRRVLFGNGLFLTRGQHKGAMLQVLMNKYGVKPKAVVFTDNSQKHINAMEQTYGSQSEVDATIFRYRGGDASEERFQDPEIISKTDEELKQWEPRIAPMMKDRSPLEMLK